MRGAMYDTVQEAFNNLQNLSPKEKYRKIRSVANLAEKALNNASDIKEIELYYRIFKLSGNSRALNRCKSKELELRGITEIKTLNTKFGVVNIESGLIAIGDPSLGYTGEYNSMNVVNSMNQNNFYCVGTGGDGTFDVTLRLVDIEEPLLGSKEFKYIINNSKTSVIKITSGSVKCSDFWDLSRNETEGVGYKIENGYYKVSFYLKDIRDKYFGYVVVLSKTSAFRNPELTDIETLS